MEERWEEFPALLDGELMCVGDARLPVTDDGLLRGDGAFEIVRLYQGRAFRLAAHLKRLAGSCARLRLPLDAGLVFAEAERLAAQAPGSTCDMRIIVTRGGRRLLMLEPARVNPPRARLALVSDRVRPLLQGAKTLSYVANMLAMRIARERGATDALLVTPEGHVLEAQTAAFFWVDSRGRLCTPPLDEGILASVTRQVVLETVGADERPCLVDEALDCREAFLASTTREVQPVEDIEGKPLAAAPGPVTRRAVEAFWETVARELGVSVRGARAASTGS